METDLPEKIRTFVAIFPPVEVADALRKVQSEWQHGLSPDAVNWTLPKQIHITLTFLGNIQSARLGEFQKAISDVSSKIPASSLQCRGLGCFPIVRNPRVLWAGLTGELDPLLKLKTFLDDALKPLGFIPEERPFHPHLTLGRVKHADFKERERIRTMIENSTEKLFGDWRVEKMELMRSILSPNGSYYSVLETFPLGG